jgi:hypothetical protein
MARIFLTTALNKRLRKMTMNDNKYLLQIIEDLYLNVLEDVPDTYYTKHLHCSLADAQEVLIEAGVLKDE